MWGPPDGGRSAEGEGLPVATTVEMEGGFRGFDIDTAASVAAAEDLTQVGEPLITGPDFGPSVQLQSSRGAVLQPTLAPDHSTAGVELQAAGATSTAAATAADSNGVMDAMRQVGQAWGAFDRQFMQPMFRGPGTPRDGNSRSSPRGATGSSSIL